ncbi:MAG: hypothetical protein ACE5GZ_00010 [Gammaproteobacteria bacterium]
MLRQIIYLFCLGLVLLVPACSSTPKLPDSATVREFNTLLDLFEEEDVMDARYRTLDDRGYLQIDLSMRYQIPEYRYQTRLSDKKDFVIAYLKEARALGDRVVAGLLQKLPPKVLDEFSRDYMDTIATARVTGGLLADYRKYSAQRLATDIKQVQGFSSVKALNHYWDSLISDIEEAFPTAVSVTRRLLTAPGIPFAKWWLAQRKTTDNRGSYIPHFRNQTRYYPGPAGPAPEGMAAEEWSLLRRYAPVIVQGTDPEASYPVYTDRFGTVLLKGKNLLKATPAVDTGRPAVYTYMERKSMQGGPVKQLIYTLWYPQHPKQHFLDTEAGPMDGRTLRITLNQENRPLLFESVSNSGLYYKVFPTQKLEELSQRVFPEKLESKSFYVENHVEGKYDVFVPEVIPGINTPEQKIVLYYSAGRHRLITIRSDEYLLNEEKARRRQVISIRTAADKKAKRQQITTVRSAQGGQLQISNYSLRAYGELENLPFNGYHASLFDTHGLVRKAYRLEGKLLTPAGLYHAGQPRQRETQMIHFDEALFDDPRLLETYLRLPPGVFKLSL